MSVVYESQPVMAGDTLNWVLRARRNGATWNLTGATVSLYFRNQAGTVYGPYSAELTDAANGVAEYQNESALLTGGTWRRHWLIAQAAVTRRSREIGFDVLSASE